MLLTDHPAYRLVSEHARALARRIAGEAARDLEAMREPLLSGEDSGLTSIWQEICVQLQGEESFFWDAYRLAMRDAVSSRLFRSPLSDTEKEMLWLRTREGRDWLCEVVHAGDEPAPEHPGVDDDAIVEWIVRDFLYDLAEKDSSPNVERFLGIRGS